MFSVAASQFRPTQAQELWGRESTLTVDLQANRKSVRTLRFAVVNSDGFLVPIEADILKTSSSLEELRTLHAKDLETIPPLLLRRICGAFSFAIEALRQNRPATPQSPVSSEMEVHSYAERREFADRIALLQSHLVAIEAALKTYRAVSFKL